MDERIQKIIFTGIGFLPILFLLMICSKLLESFIALGICNLLAFIAVCIGNAGDTLQKNERKTVFLFGSYYSLFAICFLIMFVFMALNEHLDTVLIFAFMLTTLIILMLNVKGVWKYRK